MTTATAPKLSADQARKLHAAEVKASRLETELSEAKAARDKLRTRYRSRVPLVEDIKERAKGVLEATVGGVFVRVFPQAGRRTFKFGDYLEAGHAVTPEMKPFVSRGQPFDRWTVKDVRGPAHLDRVEPKP